MNSKNKLMLESLYSKTLEKKGNMKEEIQKFDNYNFNVANSWNNINIRELNDDFVIAAGDGSKNEKNFLKFIFYAVSAESLIFAKKLFKIETSDIGIMPHSKFSNDRIRNYMSLFELKNALKTFKNYDVDYYLYDGSIMGDLIRPLPLEKDISQSIKQDILDLATDHLNKDINNIKNMSVDIASAKIANFFKNELDIHKHEIFLESIEKLIALYNLLKYKKNIIAISKTSTANDYFKSEILDIPPDICIFDMHSQEIGFSSPITKPAEMKNIKGEFPIYDSFFKSLEFTIFYARLEKNKNILKIELPYKANIKQIKEIISILANDSIEGYPYLLKKAHHDVIIRSKDIEQLSKIIGFYEKSGREML